MLCGIHSAQSGVSSKLDLCCQLLRVPKKGRGVSAGAQYATSSYRLHFAQREASLSALYAIKLLAFCLAQDLSGESQLKICKIFGF